ncbi:MAG: uroporphyrinogen-III C-methyltransferase [Thermoanaerobacteraceae bacterium]|nr:uroporphyrinogen-III C-methyltransferase [Thermoanaerobacteraceae bacterium]
MTGKVYLIGAGPGNIELLTLRAVDLIKEVDVLVYDRLINEEILNLSKDDVELIDVGKLPDMHKVPQWKINEIIAEKALEGKSVARIKGGDPFVFGRGGEEAEYLVERGITYEIVPGVTSAISVLSYAGIPVTHRALSSSFHVITGHECEEKNHCLDWNVLAKLNGTLIFLMGIKNLETIVNNLMKDGKSSDTPVAVIMNGTTPNQKVVTGKLLDIADKVCNEGIKNPAIIVVGDVVKLRNKLMWFEEKRLFSKRILLTRGVEMSAEMSKLLRNYGAEVVLCPSIKITLLSDNIKKLLDHIGEYDYIVFTSVNGVLAFTKAVYEKKFDLRKLNKIKIAAIGSKTAEALNKNFLYPDIIPEEYTSKALAEKMKDSVKDRKIALLTSDIGGEVLIGALKDFAHIEKVVAYKNEPNFEIKDKLIKELDKGIDIALFTSPSTFNYMHKIIEDKIGILKNFTIAAIGPVTKRAIEDKGFKVSIMPQEYTMNKLIESIL